MDKNPIRMWRDDRSLSQEELAKLVGVKAMTVSRWERGEHLPHRKHWAAIESATGIAASALVEHVKTSGATQ